MRWDDMSREITEWEGVLYDIKSRNNTHSWPKRELLGSEDNLGSVSHSVIVIDHIWYLRMFTKHYTMKAFTSHLTSIAIGFSIHVQRYFKFDFLF